MNSPVTLLRRKATAVFGLALFMLGSHYCLVGALMPGGMQAMACIAPMAAKADAGAHAGMPACHGGAASQEGDEDTAPATTSPCCVSLTPVVTPHLDKFATDGSLLLPVFDAADTFRAPALASVLLRAPPESPPLHAPPRAHASPRAPPLS